MRNLSVCAPCAHDAPGVFGFFTGNCCRTGFVAAFLAATFLSASHALAASYRTENFIVTARTQSLAREIGDAAEQYRKQLAVDWLGSALPRWSGPCPIVAEVGDMGAGGATSFKFRQGMPFSWRMSIQGSRERILDSVLPHEITHTIFATHFGRPLPRWADEGACTSVEHPSERARQDDLLQQFLRCDPPRSIAFNEMFRMMEYPHEMLPLYAQGHSVARFLLYQGGKRKFVDFIGYGMESQDWDSVTREFYGYRDLSELQLDWIDWVGKGSPKFGSEGSAPAGTPPVLAATLGTNVQPGNRTALTNATALPPLLRPSDKEMESAFNAVERDRLKAGFNRRATEAHASVTPLNGMHNSAQPGRSWYASPSRLKQPSGGDDRRLVEPLPLPGPVPPPVASFTSVRPQNQLTRISKGVPSPRSLLPPADYPITPSVATDTSAMRWRHYQRKPILDQGELEQTERKPVFFDAPVSPRLRR